MRSAKYLMRKIIMNEASDAYRFERVNYANLSQTLRGQVIWSYDTLLEAYIPGELPIDIKYADLRALYNAGAYEPRGRTRTREQLRAEFQRDGYVKIPQLFGSDYAINFLTPYYWRMRAVHERRPDMEGVRRSSANNLPLFQHLHQATERLIKYITQEDVKTSYSFASAYEAGSAMPPHTDRSQCVYNVSVLLGAEPADVWLSEWPLMIEAKGKVNVVCLEHGDAVLYSGTRDKHWRDPMPAKLSSVFGVFFHYVPASFTGSLD